MNADRPDKNAPSLKVVVDESLISPKGWMTLDSLGYLKAVRAGRTVAEPVCPPCEDILDLGRSDLSVVRLARRDNDNSVRQDLRRIPAGDIVSIGGTDLKPRTSAQPFEDQSDAANDNLGRFLLLLVLLLAVIGGYSLMMFGTDDHRVIEVTPPESPAIRITSLEPAIFIRF